MVTNGPASSSSSPLEPLEDQGLGPDLTELDAKNKAEKQLLEDRKSGEGLVILFSSLFMISAGYLLKHYVWIMVEWLGSGLLQCIGYTFLIWGLVATRFWVAQRLWKFIAPALATALCALMTYTIMEYFKIANPDAYFLSAMGGLMVNAACLLAFEEKIFGYLSVTNVFGIGALECYFPYLLASYQIDRKTFAWLGLLIGLPAVLKNRWRAEHPMVNKLQEPFFVISYLNYLIFSTALAGPIYFPIGGKPEPIWIMAIFFSVIPLTMIMVRQKEKWTEQSWVIFVALHGLFAIFTFFAGCLLADGVVRAWGLLVVSILGMALGDYWMHDKVWFWNGPGFRRFHFFKID